MIRPSNYRRLAGTGWVQYGHYQFYELARQEYAGNHCVFATGLVEGHPHDSHYVWLEKEGALPTILFLRPDELATLTWLCSGAPWSKLIDDHMQEATR